LRAIRKEKKEKMKEGKMMTTEEETLKEQLM
jgi:hypothetical protein